ncbi:MAG: hypothetical protein RI580_01130 [Halothece sp. Uz-M2-17]|nr:hypothetical protein [Halothece sp. Uz-M2-17]
MPKQAYSLQLTFHYNNGEKESFLVTESAEESNPYPELRQGIQQRLNQQWCPLHTGEETVYVNMNNVDTVTVKPSLGDNQEEIAFHEAQRITALTRSSKVL